MLEYAYNRTETNLGSSKFNRPEVVLDGIFSRNETLNPEFYNWNFIYINYCDGTGIPGLRSRPPGLQRSPNQSERQGHLHKG